LVIEIDVSESFANIRSNRQLYLNYLTGVNVYIGVSYNQNQDNDTWDCCIATRNINLPNPPPADPGRDWPPFISVRESNDTYYSLSAQAPATWTFNINTGLLWYPQKPPPGLPPAWIVNCEDIQQVIFEAI